MPAIIVSPWVEPGSVYNEEYRHTSLIATLRKTWGLGEAFTQRDASARTFDHVFSRDTPRDPQTWVSVKAQPVPEWAMDAEVVGKALSTSARPRTRPHREGQEMGVTLPAELDDPETELTPSSSSTSSGSRLALLPATRTGGQSISLGERELRRP